ncbi:mechanosensitive ion channel domain-containing protein [Thalassorhabdomicrobium marinisediminis]|uniref:Small-conductance mechanosensitive channel n=1 Tax=Thalassorhabdomicrobium marinisediminis TaxID=2170577 RepID=A0A2T7FSY3_9RHOB|nr:mechanosensitive ion channel domain-containing protein [Thalassorhabdomicrobium marinisediminis]PVA05242.1 mechanosensitive ion channel protein MscS [Thalassorhabdomicrobium marinisediminis]
MSFLRLCLLTLTLLFPALTTLAQEGPSGTITTEQSRQQDADIAVRIREILHELGNYDDVTVTVREGIVRLRGTTASMAEAQALEPLVSRVEGVVAVRNDVTETAELARRLDPAVDRFMARVNQLLVVLPLLVIAALVMGLITIIGFLVARMRQPWDRLAPNAFIADVFRQFVRIAFVIIGLVVALDILNATALLSTILGAAGLIGLAIGFAVRDTVENFIASVMLSIRQPFRPNDVVEINGDQGKVIRLTSRATILLSFDGNHIRIPNATVFKARIINFSENRERRFLFTVGIDSATDLAKARDLAKSIVHDLPFVLPEPKANAWLGDITDAGTELNVAGWIDQTETSLLLARGEALRLVKLALEHEGIALPNTTYTLDLPGPFLPAEASAETPTPASPTPPPKPQGSRAVAEVSSEEDGALDRMIDAERQSEEKEDLLREDAATE